MHFNGQFELYRIQYRIEYSRHMYRRCTPFEKWFLVRVGFSKKSVTVLLSRYFKGYSCCLFCMNGSILVFIELIKYNRKFSVYAERCELRIN